MTQLVALKLNQMYVVKEDLEWLDIPFEVVRYAFDLAAFFITSAVLFFKQIILALIDLFSIFGISGPEDVVLWLLSVSSVVFILSKLGWLPERVDRAINRNQRSEISTALQLLGIKEQEVRSKFRKLNFQGSHSRESIVARAKDIIRAHETKKSILVGSTNPAFEKSFVDLMGGSTSHQKAVQMAALLKAFIGSVSADASKKNIPDFDYVATPKSGSPLIGYEFSKLVQKPLMLHSIEPKYKDADGKSNPIAHFDLNFVPNAGATVLIIDDSSTGGRKIQTLISDLKNLDLKVDHCIVIFEPQSKVGTKQNAAEVLSPVGVNLVSILKHP
ncbi:MAG: hypothetical protein ACU0DH_13375 [Paracoccus sp. (in: a-proteobacteria)]|uniref:hypothetical protein n=1 Tax=Paracoccus sp. TaxID=267 RepID=UPI00405803DD